MARTSEDAVVAFLSLIRAIHDGKRDSFWYRILDDDKDIPDRLPANTDKETKKGVVNRKPLSLRQQLGVKHCDYIAFLKKHKIVLEKNTQQGIKLTFKKATLETLLVNNEVHGSEIELAKIVANQGRWYLRLGNKHKGYFKNVRAQVNAGVYSPPRHQQINSMQKRLRQLLSSNGNILDNSSDNDASEAENDGNRSGNSSTDTAIVGGNAIGSDEFQILCSLGINLDLTHKSNANRVKDIIGELLALQLRHSSVDKKATNEFHR